MSEIFKCVEKLLNDNGVCVYVEGLQFSHPGDDMRCVRIEKEILTLDFSEHDKVFEDKIEDLQQRIRELIKEKDEYKRKCNNFGFENQELKQRIAELERKETEKPTKINLNDRIKVKLTPLGAEIYYHQYDEVDKKIKANGGKEFEPTMPEIDKDGFTEIQLWHFIELYGEHIGVCKPNVINPLNIVIAE